MPEFDLLIRGAANLPAIGISDGKIAALQEGDALESLLATLKGHGDGVAFVGQDRSCLG